MANKSAFGTGVVLTLSCLGALYVAACGGSASFHDEPGGSAGSAATAGSAGVGGTVGTAGSSNSGGTGQCIRACPAIACAPGFVSKPTDCCPTCVPAGGDAGSSNCGAIACPDIGCGPGTTPIVEPGQCCPSCVPNGTGGVSGTGGAAGAGGGCAVACELPLCGAGYTPVTEPGACCPSCVPDSQACTAGEQGYETLLASLLTQPGALSCTVDQDCALLNDAGQCGDQCANTAVNAAEEPDMARQLTLWAKTYCSTCVEIYPPCLAPPKPFCEGGQCQLYHAL